ALPGDAAARAGGLAVALREALARRGGVWFGWSGETVEGPPGQIDLKDDPRDGRIRYATFDLNAGDYRAFYGGFANGVIWPLFHLRPGLSLYHRAAFEGYSRVNAAFAERLVPLLRADDVIWVHDYHFMPLAAECRRRNVRNRIGFFLHIPFPPPELLVTLPVHKSLMADLLCYDLIGLQTADDVRSLARYVAEEVKGRLGGLGRLEALGRSSRVAAFPIGIDTSHFAELAEQSAARPEVQRLRDSLLNRDLVIG